MRRFRTKKTKEGPVVAPATAPSTPLTTSAPPLPVFPPGLAPEAKAARWFGMGGKKSVEEEAKPRIDLASALPSNDEFRTSLLMTGLSARFSMLREQDDPSTKVGKASDDSVLFPKRGSREFNISLGLCDIAEVESIRRPFARKNSFGSDDAASLAGSIMNRSRPTDGNNLFGGRQKVYKLVEGRGGMSGRALYDDDVALSAFQRLRREEKQRRAAETGREDDEIEDPDQDQDQDQDRPDRPTVPDTSRAPSPPAFNRRRETSSTTSSVVPSLARLSTAATSVNSTILTPSSSVKDWTPTAAQNSAAAPSPAERTVARTRRLYEQGLNQELHDNQSSALHRLDTLSRRGFGGPAASPSPSSASSGGGGNMTDRFGERRSLLGKASAPNLRATLTPAATSSPRLSPVERSSLLTAAAAKESAATSMPLTPPVSDAEEQTFQPMVPDEQKEQREQRTGLGIAKPSPFRKLGLDTKNTEPPPPPSQRTREPTPPAKDATVTSFLAGPDSPDELEAPTMTTAVTSSPLTRTLPPSEIHPLLRGNALPTPPAVVSMAPSPIERAPDLRRPSTKSAHDSPTLGLTTGGLSGMVRQHLRADSNASSIYGPSSQPPDEELVAHDGGFDTKQGSDFSYRPRDWDADTRDRSGPGEEASVGATDPQDEFASRLADGARRVRERMTSYVDADSPTTAPPRPFDRESDVSRPSTAGPRNKPSLASLADRARDSRTKKLGLAAATMTTMTTTGPEDSAPIERTSAGGQQQQQRPQQEEDSVHAGLRAFRQAKREMQRLREIETNQRHVERSPPSASPSSSQSRDRRRPPVSYQRQSDDSMSMSMSMSRSSSRAPSARERSESETSGSGSRPPRLRLPMASPVDGGVGGVGGNGHKKPMARSPGLPGTDIRGSPHMPPVQPYPGPRFDRSLSTQNLAQPPYRAHESGAVSPLGLASPLSPFGQYSVPSSPATAGRPPAPEGAARFDDSMRRSIRKQDISGPTFMSTTSQVPTVSLETGRSQPRSRPGSVSSSSGGGAESAPPLPPINPKRRVLGSPGGRRGEDDDVASPSTTGLPFKPPSPPRRFDSRGEAAIPGGMI